jgi:hypothetical protein
MFSLQKRRQADIDKNKGKNDQIPVLKQTEIEDAVLLIRMNNSGSGSEHKTRQSEIMTTIILEVNTIWGCRKFFKYS